MLTHTAYSYSCCLHLLESILKERAMEWTQIAAWIAWAWVVLMSGFAALGLVSLFLYAPNKNPSLDERLEERINGPKRSLDEQEKGMTFAFQASVVFVLMAILGLMLIQTLELSV